VEQENQGKSSTTCVQRELAGVVTANDTQRCSCGGQSEQPLNLKESTAIALRLLTEHVQTTPDMAVVRDLLLVQERILAAQEREIRRLRVEAEALRACAHSHSATVDTPDRQPAAVANLPAVRKPRAMEGQAPGQGGMEVTDFLKRARLTGAEADQALKRINSLLATRAGHASSRRDHRRSDAEPVPSANVAPGDAACTERSGFDAAGGASASHETSAQRSDE
jgi:hypothetical protein